MKSETEIERGAYGFTWFEVDGEYYLKTVEDGYRQVNRQVVELLRTFAEGDLTRDQLLAQIDGGEAVIAEESTTSAEQVLALIDDYIEQGVVDEDAPVVRLQPPEDVRLWPRVLLLLLLLTVVGGVVASNVSLLRTEFVNQLELWKVAIVMIAGYVFLFLHELGHYFAGSKHFEPSIQVDFVNGVIPAAVTDTTGAWMLPRNRRIWINLAGPFLELSAVLPLLGLYYTSTSSPFFVMIAGIVLSHTVFSLNPLIHGDGFWILCDYFGLSDVRTRGIEDLKSKRVSWRASYVIASYGFGGLVMFNSVVLTFYLVGPRGLVFVAPLLVFSLLSRTDYRLTPSIGSFV